MSDIGMGDLVVCLKSNWPDCTQGEITPMAEKVYTVRGLRHEGNSIWLEEIVNQPRPYRAGVLECCFRIRHFRPISAPDADEFFRQLAEPKTVTA